MNPAIPARVLIIDDLFGREVPGATNRERENLCGKFLLEEELSEGHRKSSRFEIPNPTARVVFCRGQTPVNSGVGALVENDLQGTLEVVREGWTKAMDRGHTPWSMVLLDLCFYTGQVTEESHRRTPGMPEGRPGDDDPRSYFGLTLLDTLHREFPELPIFILSSKPREEVSLEFSRRGALGFIARDDARGPELLEEALWQHGFLPDPAGDVVGNSLPLLLVLREARRAAQHRENILIRGERGTGKELLAWYVHRVSEEIPETDNDVSSARKKDRLSRPFVTVNSAVFIPSLFASELFGIQPKTATGVDGKIGLIEMANGGDLFLDEIADMPTEVQAAILRVLQERQVTQVGARMSKEVDVRFLSATNANIEDTTGGFRSDLLDRLRIGGTLLLPPLSERPTDILLLVEKFVREAEARRKGALRREITPEALETLVAHDWPGNIRELRSTIFDAVTRHPDVEYLVARHIRLQTRPIRGGSRLIPRSTLRGPGEEIKAEHILQPEETQDGLYTDRKALTGAHGAVDEATLDRLLAEIEAFAFKPNAVGEWAGRLLDVQTACARLLARHLEVCLEATKRRTPELPDGIIQIHPAIKLLTGDSKITASKAADAIKRLLGPLEEELSGNLREAYDIAIRLRPKSAATPAKEDISLNT